MKREQLLAWKDSIICDFGVIRGHWIKAFRKLKDLKEVRAFEKNINFRIMHGFANPARPTQPKPTSSSIPENFEVLTLNLYLSHDGARHDDWSNISAGPQERLLAFKKYKVPLSVRRKIDRFDGISCGCLAQLVTPPFFGSNSSKVLPCEKQQ